MSEPAIGTPQIVHDDAGAHVTVTIDVTDGSSPLTLTAATPGGSAVTVVDVTPPVPRWSQVHGPGPLGDVVVDGPMLLDCDTTTGKVTVTETGVLTFDPTRTVTLAASGNVAVYGTLRIRPGTPEQTHTLRFTGVNEAGFIGGSTHVPLDADIGLWMTSHTSGILDVAGTPKRGWTRLTGAAAAGATQITVNAATGWRAGDELVIAPTEPATVAKHSTHADRIRIAAVTGNTITLAAPLAWPHPTYTSPNGAVWTAEVCNLTRNVKIEGTPSGRAHILIHGGHVQAFSHTELSHLGPRKPVAGQTYTDLVSGRYGLHLHHAGDSSRGLTVYGVVAHDLGNRAFVPHATHGITFTDCVAWNVMEDGYWWDMDVVDDESNDITYDRCAAGWVTTDPPSRGQHLTGFNLSAGISPVLRNCAVFAIQGKNRATGYEWPEATNSTPNNVWTFEDNVTHNNAALGSFVWQNDQNQHVVTRLTAYRNGLSGVLHGAYRNAYDYRDVETSENGAADLELHASSHGSTTIPGQEHTGGHIPHLLIEQHNLPANKATTFRDVTIDRVTVREEIGTNRNPGFIDFVNCGLEPADFTRVVMHPQSVYRVQTAGQAWRVTATGAEPIPLFA